MSGNQNDEFDELIRPVMMIGRVVNFWPQQIGSGSNENKLRNFRQILIFFLMISISLAVTADAFHSRDDMDEVTECGLLSAAFYLAVLRLIVFSTHQKEMLFIVQTMKADWSESSSENRLILNEKCGFSYKISKFFIFTVTVAMASFVVLPCVEIFLLDGDRDKLPFGGYIFIDHTISPIFECVLVVNIAAGVLGCTTIAAATSFSLVSVIHSAAKFSILQRRLKNLKSGDGDVDKALKDCVVQHQECIKFAEVLEKVISPLALGQFVISSGLLCFAGFQITSNKADKQRLMKYCTFLQSAILELFLFSYSGNQLIKESEAIGYSAYSSDWIGSSFAKSIQIIMIRVRNPSKITAAKFYDLSLESFSKVLSTSFSYFTVLQAANE